MKRRRKRGISRLRPLGHSLPTHSVFWMVETEDSVLQGLVVM